MGDNQSRQPLQVILGLLEIEESTLLGSKFFEFRLDFFLQQSFNFVQFQVLLGHRLCSFLSSVLEHSGARSLLNHGKNFNSLHVQHFRDAPLHNEEVRVVNIQLNTLEEILHRLLLRAMTVDQVFARSTEDDLSSNGDGRVFLKTNRRLGSVAVIEDDSHAGLGHTRLSTLVNKILKILCSNGRHVRDSENEADGI